MKPLIVEQFPLTGHQLIEASAGTGKTYTITNLYLRLLLGHSQALGRPLAVNEILVLTFTVAATDELRARIRGRINAAREALLAGNGGDDRFFTHLIDTSTDTTRDLRLLAAALQMMDEAAIHTIHGFCQQVLNDESFATGTLFDQRLDADRDQLLALASQDCFRTDILALPDFERGMALAIWPDPDALLNATKSLLNRPDLQLRPPSRDITDELQTLREQVQHARDKWHATDFPGFLRSCGINKGRKSLTRLPLMETYLADPVPRSPFNENWGELTRPAVIRNLTKNSPEPAHALFELIEKIADAQSLQQQIHYNLWHQVIARLRQNLAHYQTQLNQLTLDDLLTGVYRALHAPAGDVLARQLADQWPVAMIDEFQDTDDIQYGIFNRIYGQPGLQSLLMIGDPKQAIYQFRGADIYTYINAKRALDPQQNLHSLGTNYRSSGDMVDAVNHLFNQPNIFGNDADMPFEPVDTPDRARPSPLKEDGHCAPITLFAPVNATGSLKAMAATQLAMDYAAEQVATLLTGSARLDDKPLHAGQIAFLVRNRREMEVARAALARRDIRAVYVTQDSVFTSSTAADLALVLQAVTDNNNLRALRLALATRLLQTPASIIAGLDADIHAQQALVTEFHDYHDVWRHLGVGAMIDSLIQRRQLGRLWLGKSQGERELTNLRHLAELLQQRANIAPGMLRLITWFQQERRLQSTRDESRQLRLESDENLVQIVTMHAAKGLEYDIVMIPLANFSPNRYADKPPLLLHDDVPAGDGNGEPRFTTIADLSSDDGAKQQALREVMEEEMRLLYVALTRAKYRCYLGVPILSQQKPAPLARLLGFPAGKFSLSELESRIRQMPGDLFCFDVVEAVPVTPSTPQATAVTLSAPPPMPRVADSWRVHSYTGLTRLLRVLSDDTDMPDETGNMLSGKQTPSGFGDDDADDNNGTDNTVASSSDRYDAFTFPRGRKIGVGLHSLLEHLDFAADEADKRLAAGRCIQRLGLTDNLVEWEDVLVKWLDDILLTPVQTDKRFCLSDISTANRLDELEFHFPVSADQSLVNCLRQAGYLNPKQRLSLTNIRGIMTGLIDLVVRHDDRYYVIDYKSNHLGDSASDYNAQALQAAMTHHQYDLQYLLYTVALHRYLRQQLPGYTYDTHMGGTVYLFLRGMQRTTANSGIFFDLPDKALIYEMDALLGGEG